MEPENVAIFFYGLFMDRSLLESRGIVPSSAKMGHVEGYGLRIGSRATLVPSETDKAYGVLMKIRAEDVKSLYSEESVADYVPEPVTVILADGNCEPAVCYNLPADKLEGTNARYASALVELAERLGLPGAYVRQIRRQVA